MTIEYNIVLKNAYIADGSGTPLYRADIGITGDTITSIGEIPGSKADKVIDCSGLVVSPGFIDMHSHSDMTLLVMPESLSKIMQGVTTEVVGNCGISPGPVEKTRLSLLKEYINSFFASLGDRLPWSWKSLNEYYVFLEQNGIAVNIVPLVGHGSLRIAVMGVEDRSPSRDELDEMIALLEEEVKDASWGMSTGLVYPPGIYSDTSELIELSSAMRRYNGLYFSHIRNEGDLVAEAIREAIEIGAKSSVAVEISHLKIMGRNNWGRSREISRLIEDARENGVNVDADMYPYTAGQTGLYALLPPWAQEGGINEMLARISRPEYREKIIDAWKTRGKERWQNWVYEIGWSNIILAYTASEKYKVYEGKSFEEISRATGTDPYQLAFDILLDSEGSTSIILFYGSESDLEYFLTRPWTTIGSDHVGLRPDAEIGSAQHPRAYGTFPRILARYVREKGVLGLTDAVRKMTFQAARKLGLRDRGLVYPGFKADLVVFDMHEIADQASYKEPHRFPKGIKYVIVNGRIVVENGEYNGEKPGRVLRRGRESFNSI